MYVVCVKQKTSYEMRISDWSSDVCSSDRVVVVALGGNDLLQGLDPKATQANLERILKRLKERHMGVVLGGLHAPPELGRAYARDFDAAFAGVAKAYDRSESRRVGKACVST